MFKNTKIKINNEKPLIYSSNVIIKEQTNQNEKPLYFSNFKIVINTYPHISRWFFIVTFPYMSEFWFYPKVD